MKWISRLPEVEPQLGDRRVLRAFAVFPVKDSKGISIWLEPFNRIQQYKEYTELLLGGNQPWPIRVQGWVTVEVEHLCSFPRIVRGGFSKAGTCLCGKNGM